MKHYLSSGIELLDTLHAEKYKGSFISNSMGFFSANFPSDLGLFLFVSNFEVSLLCDLYVFVAVDVTRSISPLPSRSN